MAGHRNQLQIILVGQLLIRFANRIETVKKRHPVPFLNDIADRLDQSRLLKRILHPRGGIFSLELHKQIHKVKGIGAGKGNIPLIDEK